jgi:hypothetical protein
MEIKVKVTTQTSTYCVIDRDAGSPHYTFTMRYGKTVNTGYLADDLGGQRSGTVSLTSTYSDIVKELAKDSVFTFSWSGGPVMNGIGIVVP